jgi:hypothetical protein
MKRRKLATMRLGAAVRQTVPRNSVGAIRTAMVAGAEIRDGADPCR